MYLVMLAAIVLAIIANVFKDEPAIQGGFCCVSIFLVLCSLLSGMVVWMNAPV